MRTGTITRTIAAPSDLSPAEQRMYIAKQLSGTKQDMMIHLFLMWGDAWGRPYKVEMRQENIYVPLEVEPTLLYKAPTVPGVRLELKVTAIDDVQQPADVMWLVGRVIPDECGGDGVLPWEFMGLFTNSDEAEAACTNWYDFVAPVEINWLFTLLYTNRLEDTRLWWLGYWPARAWEHVVLMLPVSWFRGRRP